MFAHMDGGALAEFVVRGVLEFVTYPRRRITFWCAGLLPCVPACPVNSEHGTLLAPDAGAAQARAPIVAGCNNSPSQVPAAARARHAGHMAHMAGREGPPARLPPHRPL